MKLIAHRGNVNGPVLSDENNPEYVDSAIKLGYDVEIDLRLEEHKFYLGHDEPQYYVPMTWLVSNQNNLWIHCKDLNSLNCLSNSPINFNYFWHQEDDFTLTSQNYIWTYPGKQYSLRSVVVLPENNIPLSEFKNLKDFDCYGICSDYVGEIN